MLQMNWNVAAVRDDKLIKRLWRYFSHTQQPAMSKSVANIDYTPVNSKLSLGLAEEPVVFVNERAYRTEVRKIRLRCCLVA